MENNLDHGNNVVNKEQMTAKDYLQNKYPSMKKHWNETDIDDNWVAQMMEDFANQQTSSLLEKVKELREKLYKNIPERLKTEIDHGLNSAFELSVELLDELISNNS